MLKFIDWVTESCWKPILFIAIILLLFFAIADFGHAQDNELVSERTANAKVFDIGGGQRLVKVYTVPIHYEQDGQFKTIDTAIKKRPLVTAILSKYKHRANSGVYDAFFDSEKPWNYRFEVGDKWIEYEALFEESASLIIEVETNLRGVKETITLLDNTAPTVFKWIVKSNGLQPDEPWAIDAERNYLTVNHYSLGDTLVYEVDVSGAVYPIELDPSTTIQTANDGYVQGKDAQATYAEVRDGNGINKGTAGLIVGQDDWEGIQVNRTFTSFSIPSLSSVVSCVLYVNGANNWSANDFDIYIHGATEYGGIIEYATFPKFDGRQTGQAHNGTILNDTWNSSSYSADWNMITFNAAGIDSVEAAQGSTLYIALISSHDYNNSATYGASVQFDSSEVSGTEPYLSITYTVVASSVWSRIFPWSKAPWGTNTKWRSAPYSP